MKKFIVVLLIVIALSLAISPTYASSVRLELNNSLITENLYKQSSYVTDSGRVLIPLRFVAEGLGSEVSWNSLRKEVSIFQGDVSLRLIIGQKIIYRNGQELLMDTAATITNSTTMVPLRFVAENLGATISWDAYNKIAKINMNNILSETSILETGTGTIVAINPTSDEETSFLSDNEKEMLRLVNEARAENNLPPLKISIDLTKLARLKSQDIIANNYFNHCSPTYGSPFEMMDTWGIEYNYAGENLAGNQSIYDAHTNLMNSPGHRANILNKNYKYIGIGIEKGSKYGYIFTQMFIG